MADKPNMLNDLVKGALTTAISVIVTYYVTAAIKKDQYQQTDSEKEKQRTESLDKTSALLNNYISRYDSLHARYISLAENRRGSAGDRENESYRENTTSSQNDNASTLSINGNWITPDGTVGWRFEGNRVMVNGIGSYIGFIEGAGSHQVSGSMVSGTIQVSKAFYLPVNESLSFNFSLSSDNRVLYGTNTDAAGTVNALTLYRN